MKAVDLELTLRARGPHYEAQLSCILPNQDAPIDNAAHPAKVFIDRGKLQELTLDLDGYGLALGHMLLAEPQLAQFVAQARALAERQQVPLCVRLVLAADAAELHQLRWETLRDPAHPDTPLLTTGEQVLFSRYLSSADWTPVGPRPMAVRRTLVLLACPTDLQSTYGLDLFDVEAERTLIAQSFGSIPTTVLSTGQAHLEALIEHLRSGPDILFILAHGRVDADGETWLYLEGAGGLTKPVRGSNLARRLAELIVCPQLVILGSCESAGDGHGPALLSLGPRLAEAGVPAVLAMQGKITVETLREFLPVCLRVLEQRGRIDQAVAVARGAVRERPDFWVPVLFLRLPHGQLWETVTPHTVAQPQAMPALGWLARTKLLPPRLRRDNLDRQRLVQAVRQALGEVRLVLVSAPAGSGKTMLLASALAQPGNHTLAWLTLDDEDNDLIRFLHALVAAIAQRSPQAAGSAALLLQQAGPDQADTDTLGRVVARALVNGLAELTQPLVLVLDDLHAVREPAVYTALDYLLERLPPHITLAIGTRHDPPLALTRLRARSELVELRLPELRFTAEEVGTLLNQRHGLQLSPAELARLHQRTEGWAAGLTLLASSLGRLASGRERQQFLERLAHTDRHLFDYLAEEVFNRQEPFVRMFLLETAILPELTPEACRVLTGCGDAGEILDDLYRRNLFLIALEHVGSTAAYRYHDLFREFLRARLWRDIPEWSRELHRLAAEAARHPAHRIFHYLQAELWDEAAEAVAEAAPDYLAQGAFDTVQQWVTRLPEPTRRDRPRLDLWQGMCLWQRFRFDAAQSCFARALVGFDVAGDQTGQSEALVWIALGANLWQDAQSAQVQIDRALAAPLQPHQQVRVLLAFALGATLHERWQEANQALDQAIDLAATSNDQAVITALAASLQAPFAFLPGGVARYERVLRLLWRFDLSNNQTALISQYVLGASVQTWRGRWEEAEADLQALYTFLATTASASWQIVNLGGVLLLNHIVRHGTPTADPALELLLNIDETQSSAFTRSVAISFQFTYARGQWLLGQLDEVRRVYRLIVTKTEGNLFPYVEAMKLLLAGLIAFAEERLDEAEREWRAAAQIQERNPFMPLFGDAHLLLAALEHKRGRPAAALVRLGPRLAAYAAENTPGILLWHGQVLAPVLQLAVTRQVHADFAARMLAGLGMAVPAVASEQAAPESSWGPGAGGALTPREIEVLRLLAEGASNPEIARRLGISLHTVKTHVASILAKLDAPSRVGATIRAHDLGLLRASRA